MQRLAARAAAVALADSAECRRRCAASAQAVATGRTGFDRYDASGPKGAEYVRKRLDGRKTAGNVLAAALALAGGAVTTWCFTDPEAGKYTPDVPFTNWSGTHAVTCKRVYEPEDEAEVVRLMQKAIGEGWRLRVCGSGISPNALSFSPERMVCMANMAKVLHVDVDAKQVRVQAGARVSDVVEALRPHGLTLQNYASVREQQIGGFTQVSAHGTGAELPPVDEQVVSLRVVAPGLGGAVEVGRDSPSFDWIRVGLGALGIVTEVTLQCVDAHRLMERTRVATRAQVRRHHKRWLRQNAHLRYMWIPYTDAVVVVSSRKSDWTKPLGKGFLVPDYSETERLAPLRELLRGAAPERATADIEALSATGLRDAALALDPLRREWVAAVNAAEAEYWRRSEGYRLGWSDEILGFDCGGQQHVLEVAFPTGGSAKDPTLRDIDYMEELLALLEARGVPAPAPIEQRWTASSTAPMSPAHSARREDMHSWVGVIMYLPPEETAPEQRAAVSAAFRDYAQLCERELMAKYGAKWHWAKLEPGVDDERRAWLRKHLAAHYDLGGFNVVRRALDPENNLGNDWLNAVLPMTRDA